MLKRIQWGWENTPRPGEYVWHYENELNGRGIVTCVDTDIVTVWWELLDKSTKEQQTNLAYCV